MSLRLEAGVDKPNINILLPSVLQQYWLGIRKSINDHSAVTMTSSL